MSFPPFSLPATEVRTLSWGARKLEYRILVARPLEPPPAEGFPVVYLLDANATFGTLTEALRLRGPRSFATNVVSAVLVGLGYPTDQPYDSDRRTYDYTWAPPEDASPHALETPSLGYGGAPDFLRLIEERVQPEIERDLPVDPRRRTLFAHSLAGLFALRTLFSGAGGFETYIVVSPSIWWARGEVMSAAASWAARHAEGHSPAPGLMLSVGEYEQTLAPWQRDAAEAVEVARRRSSRRMVDDARELAARLLPMQESGHRVVFREFPGEDHASVVLAALNQGLRFALAPSRGPGPGAPPG